MHNSNHGEYLTLSQIKMKTPATQPQILREITKISEGVRTFYYQSVISFLEF
jgi:hypothetical protein